ncbi:MAG: quinolinate synthase NadA [Chloroflexota bacterium]
MDLASEILKLKRQRNAVILAHNYQIGDIQDIADFVGDSLGLAQEAAKTPADVIVFCGVHFMAETASILCPDKRVLIPDLEAGCSLAATITADHLRAWKAEHPGAVVVSYVNTTAEVKAESDYCCTSTNAVKVVNAIPADKEVLFLPDMFLGTFVQHETGRKNMHIWWGECHVHAAISPEEIAKARAAHEGAEFLIHPECGCVSNCMYLASQGDPVARGAHILSTGGMINFARKSPAKEFVIATETGILHRLRKESPLKSFFPVSEESVCKYMKMITMEKLHRSLRDDVYVVKVPPAIADRARVSIERMLAIG